MIPPGSTLGILGGGQLGRMIALAARPLGYRVVVMDPSEHCAAKPVVEEVVVGDFDDADAAARLAERADVVTIEIEKIGVDALDAVHSRVPLRPGREILAMIRDRGRQKRWLEDAGAPLGPWRQANSEVELRQGLADLPGSCFVKSCTGGYDGRGQVETDSPDEAPSAWEQLGGLSVVVEQGLDLDYELSVLVARRPSGEVVTYAPALNHHENRILAWSAWPGGVDAEVATRAQAIAGELAAKMNLEGVLAVEMFVTRGGELLVNELAPRVHNSYHASERNAACDQFEQAVRAACDLPLGSPEPRGHAAIVNLLGDLWLEQGGVAWDAALAVPSSTLHLYGKSGPRPGRKMGHLSATGATVEEAVRRAQEAFSKL